jgi:hypothetical protein
VIILEFAPGGVDGISPDLVQTVSKRISIGLELASLLAPLSVLVSVFATPDNFL